MPALVVGGVTIPVAPEGISRDRLDWVDRARAFDGTYRASSTGNSKREWTFSTPPIARQLWDFYEGILSPVTAQTCSGDVIGGSSNLLLRSEEFDNSGVWTIQNTTIGANTGAAPDGTVTADKLQETTATGPHAVYQPTAGLINSTVYVFSVYIRQQERSWALIAINGKDAVTRGMYFNFPIPSGGVVGTVVGGAAGAIQIIDPVLGHYRVYVSGTVGTGGSTPAPVVYAATADNVNSYTGVAGNGFHLWGAQLEVGTVPTSYVKTTSVAVSTLSISACSEITGWTPVRTASGHSVVGQFTLHEV